MFSINNPRRIIRNQWCRFGVILLFLIFIAGCGGATDDLFPSGDDERPVATDETGGLPGNTSPDFALITTDYNTFTLSDYLQGGANEADAVVIYFTMWCPVCSAHMDHIQFQIMPEFTGNRVVYLAIDYLSGSTASTTQAQQDAGFAGGNWLAAADPGQVVTGIFNATMATTVVIDPSGKVRMNEDFRTGENLLQLLRELTAAAP
ncbi:MAG: peroxiredoxin family protein [Proteobacteria bacterium]|nr:peroxiredoxin family protein [Pseudomonadota bacterium]MBU1738572.1 peroxiredoxin family protein [Pseudomonadota bacterium]